MFCTTISDGLDGESLKIVPFTKIDKNFTMSLSPLFATWKVLTTIFETFV